MKSVLIIGLGDFGHHLCKKLVNMNNDVLIVDKREERMEDLADIVSDRIVADCTSVTVLQQLGISDYDICFVCVGSDFKSNLVIVSQLKELGAKYIVTETDDELLEKLLLNNGADETINPNKDSATRLAVRYSSSHIYDYRPLRDGYSIYEISPLNEWVGKSIIDCKIRERYDAYIVAVYEVDGKVDVVPNPHAVIKSDDRLMILASEKTISILLKKLDKQEK